MPRFIRTKRDKYYRQAKVVGFRARSAFKLVEICDLYGLLTASVCRVVDLCAAPGSWSQFLARELHGRARAPCAAVVAVDLQEMAPIEGVATLQGDITQRSTAERIIGHFGGAPADLVVCDGAPDVTGIHDLDEFVHAQLMVAAFNITTHVLRPGGAFVAKVFRTHDSTLLTSQLRPCFEDVALFKPTSSRPHSAENFLVCRGYRPLAGFVPDMETPAYGRSWLLRPPATMPMTQRAGGGGAASSGERAGAGAEGGEGGGAGSSADAERAGAAASSPAAAAAAAVSLASAPAPALPEAPTFLVSLETIQSAVREAMGLSNDLPQQRRGGAAAEAAATAGGGPPTIGAPRASGGSVSSSAVGVLERSSAAPAAPSGADDAPRRIPAAAGGAPVEQGPARQHPYTANELAVPYMTIGDLTGLAIQQQIAAGGAASGDEGSCGPVPCFPGVSAAGRPVPSDARSARRKALLGILEAPFVAAASAAHAEARVLAT